MKRLTIAACLGDLTKWFAAAWWVSTGATWAWGLFVVLAVIDLAMALVLSALLMGIYLLADDDSWRSKLDPPRRPWYHGDLVLAIVLAVTGHPWWSLVFVFIYADQSFFRYLLRPKQEKKNNSSTNDEENAS